MTDRPAPSNSSDGTLPATEVTLLLMAAGRGVRAGGDRPKQWQDLRGRSVASRACDAFAGQVGTIVAVIHADDRAIATGALPKATLVEGGATRGASVAAGLAAVRTAYVLIHDAARPGTPPEVVARVRTALADGATGAAPGLPVADALWRGDGHVDATVPRADLWRAQTPQGFRTDAIRKAHAAPGANDALDDVEVARKAGHAVRIVEGDPRGFKITGPRDLARAERELGMDVRVGNGFDVHRFGPGDHVTLCGVAIPHGHGLAGHSDADVGLHVLCDAIYGAIGQGDIGHHFPPSETQWEGADSAVFLDHAASLARREGWRITALDVTLICEAPKVGPHAAAMRARIGEIAALDPDRVSVKATTTERLGFAGRQEGIAAMATATVMR